MASDNDPVFDFSYKQKQVEDGLRDADISNPDSLNGNIGKVVTYILFLENTGLNGDKDVLNAALDAFDKYHKHLLEKDDVSLRELSQMYDTAKEIAERSGLAGQVKIMQERIDKIREMTTPKYNL